MPTAGTWAGDFDPRLFEMFNSAGEVLDQVQRVVRGMSGLHGRRHSEPWSKDFGGPKGPKQWGGGLGGQWGNWWPGAPGAPGAPGQARSPKAGRGDVRAAILA